jgi:phosphatidylethanolamine-binding protein (PEBP) family uncharacterized protein
LHWVVYSIPPEVTKLPAGLPEEENPAYPLGLAQGVNAWGRTGYTGPAGAPGHLEFGLYALNDELRLPAGVDGETVREAVRGHVLGVARLVGTGTNLRRAG